MELLRHILLKVQPRHYLSWQPVITCRCCSHLWSWIHVIEAVANPLYGTRFEMTPVRTGVPKRYRTICFLKRHTKVERRSTNSIWRWKRIKKRLLDNSTGQAGSSWRTNHTCADYFSSARIRIKLFKRHLILIIQLLWTVVIRVCGVKWYFVGHSDAVIDDQTSFCSKRSQRTCYVSTLWSRHIDGKVLSKLDVIFKKIIVMVEFKAGKYSRFDKCNESSSVDGITSDV